MVSDTSWKSIRNQLANNTKKHRAKIDKIGYFGFKLLGVFSWLRIQFFLEPGRPWSFQIWYTVRSFNPIQCHSTLQITTLCNHTRPNVYWSSTAFTIFDGKSSQSHCVSMLAKHMGYWDQWITFRHFTSTKPTRKAGVFNLEKSKQRQLVSSPRVFG